MPMAAIMAECAFLSALRTGTHQSILKFKQLAIFLIKHGLISLVAELATILAIGTSCVGHTLCIYSVSQLL